jgi:glycosyltransferase involved in cell wall biosynthesis
MSVKLALNFICKNESHVIQRMLSSSNGILDLILAVDTGSTDNTIELIKKYGEDNNIPTFVFERTFDSFDKSRNHGFEKLREVIKELNWKPEEVFSMWFDCDEQLVIDPKFNKNQFTKDFYMINTAIGAMHYTRNTFCRMSKAFRWYGPVHEFIVCDDKDVTSGLAEGISVSVSMDGASWQTDVSQKYLSHSHKLEAYIADSREDPRWIFYTAQSYHDSASMRDNPDENKERLRRSIKYYKERTERNDGYVEEIYYSHYRIGSIMKTLEEPWKDTMQQCLKAYACDPARGESIKIIIDHYLQMGEWSLAYLYSKFAIETFHGKSPYPNRLLFVDNILYKWKFLETHAASAFYMNKKEEAKVTYNKLLDVVKNEPSAFTPEELNKVMSNAQFFK